MLKGFSADEILNFPKVDDYIGMLKQLAEKDFTNSTKDEIENTIYDLCIVLPSICATTIPEGFNDISFFRARMKSTIGDKEDLSLEQTYSYPPPSVCKNNGRANFKYTSVFYCSDSYLASILECNPEVGDIGYLSLWKPNTNRDLKFGTYLPTNLDPYNNFASIAKRAFAFFEQEHINEPLGRQMIELRKFLAERFVNELPPYGITSYIANQALFREFENDFIIYPSSKAFAYYNNYAFHPNSVNQNLRLKKVLKFKVVDKEEYKVKIGYMAIGYIDLVNLKWRIPTKEDLLEFKLKT